MIAIHLMSSHPDMHNPSLVSDVLLDPQLLRRKHQPRGRRLPSLPPDFKPFLVIDDGVLSPGCRWVPPPLERGVLGGGALSEGQRLAGVSFNEDEFVRMAC